MAEEFRRHCRPSAMTLQSCFQPSGYTSVGGDCDDSNATINPGAWAMCDGSNVDEDCDGVADNADPSAIGTTDWYRDQDVDGYGDSTATAVYFCDAPSGYVGNNTDCDDNNAAISPGAVEVSGNGVDDDCDGVSAP